MFTFDEVMYLETRHSSVRIMNTIALIIFRIKRKCDFIRLFSLYSRTDFFGLNMLTRMYEMYYYFKC